MHGTQNDHRPHYNGLSGTPVRNGHLPARDLIDRAQIETYLRLVFGRVTSGGFFVIRAFQGSEIVRKRVVEYDGPSSLPWLVEAVEEEAQKAADRGWTLAPIPALFKELDGGVTNSERSIVACSCAVAELDKHPEEGARRLVAAFGPPSFIVYSGGLFYPEDGGEPQRKRHLYYLLNWPATDAGDLTDLKWLRVAMATIAGADRTSITLVHPLRAPGSLNMKVEGEPRPCMIEAPDAVPHYRLGDMIAAAERACPAVADRQAKPAGSRVDSRETAELVARVLDGEELHPALVPLAMRFQNRGLTDDETQAVLDVLMQRSAAKRTRPNDWADRIAELPRIVSSARQKLAREAFGSADADPFRIGADAKADKADNPDRTEAKADKADEADRIDAKADKPKRRWLFAHEAKPDIAAPWLIKGLIPAQSVCQFLGAPEAGKTAVSIDLAAHIALGREWGGRKVRQGAVAYLAFESPESIRRRFEAWRLANGVEEMPVGLFEMPVEFAPGDAFEEFLADLIDFHQVAGPLRAIIIDTQRRVTAGSENDDEATNMMIKAAEYLSKKAGCAVILIHHFGKDRSKGGRGHSNIFGAVDTVVAFTYDQRKGEGEFTTAADRQGKSRDGRPAEGRYKITGVQLGHDEDGDPVEAPVASLLSHEEAKAAKVERARKAASDKALKEVTRYWHSNTKAVFNAILDHIRWNGEHDAINNGLSADVASCIAAGNEVVRQLDLKGGAGRRVRQEDRVQQVVDRLVEKRKGGVENGRLWIGYDLTGEGFARGMS